MEGKDNRNKEKRSSMKHYKRSFHGKNSSDGLNRNSQKEVCGGVIDVADSSDDRIIGAPISWSNNALDIEFEIDTENEQMRAADFDLLTKMPNSVGGHFQFSSEKNWDAEETIMDNTEANEYFTLNLNLLSAGLQTIPFYKRLDFPTSWFLKNQIKNMNRAAEIAEKNYKIVLNGQVNADKTIRCEVEKPLRHENPVEKTMTSKETPTNDSDKELDELLKLASNEIPKATPNELTKEETVTSSASIENNVDSIQVEKNHEGIQQWLDDVLEE